MTARRAPILRDDRGFTMVEILVVILVIGILAMIALPAFLNQRAKGEDTEAKLTVRTAATALATWETDRDTFDATPAELQELEPALKEAWNLKVIGAEDTFTIRETSANGTIFTLTRAASGATERTCSQHGRGLCRDKVDDAGNWW